MRSRIAAVAGAALVGLLVTGCQDTGQKQPESSPPPATPSSSTASAAPSTSLTPVPRVFDQAAMQDAVKNVLTQAYRVADVQSVSCPASQEVRPGSKFDCTVKTGDKERKVGITVKDADGHYEVSQPD
ncbi:DUF4333 domain-containing protein [Amycolatopsis minnesotensis]|uniref:DUF4333 domain-containing protein n=1 Tax=Amycolatopsis minnesotensis TaxID=337894 RepID=A0ABP5DX16_9PSEU